MSNIIIAVIEQRENVIKKASFEAAAKAYSLANELGGKAFAVVIGNKVENINKLSAYGINEILFYNNSELEFYNPDLYKNAVTDAVKSINANCLIFPNTSLGKDLAPRVAVSLNAGLVMDCVQLNSNNNELVAVRPIFAGKALQEVSLNSEIKIFTLRPNVFSAVPGNESEINLTQKELPAIQSKTKVVEFKKAEGKLDVSEANVIVSGGRGLKGPEHFRMLEELAELLGGAVGASRAVVDAGWRSHGDQVGQTGKTVSPTLYIACGISGAIQHLAGMSSSKYIIAINKDKDAPIFTVADYGIVGDVFEVVPAFINELKKLK